jgi:hypothetical protein
MTSHRQNCSCSKSGVANGQTDQDAALGSGDNQMDCSRRFSLSNPEIRYNSPVMTSVIDPATVSVIYPFSV